MALAALDEELVDQEKQLDSYRQNLTEIMETHGFEFPPDGLTFPKVTDLAHQPYNEARENFAQLRNMLREMKIKQKEARVLLKMPHHPITIHQRATFKPSNQ